MSPTCYLAACFATSYLPYCFFNLLSPVLDVLFGFTGFKVPAEEGPSAFAASVLAWGDQDSGSEAVTWVPCRGSVSTASWPPTASMRSRMLRSPCPPTLAG